MKTCQLCGKEFRTKQIIDGKKRNLNHRKYCLECSPFGKHNTSNLEGVYEDKNLERLCNMCSKHFVVNRRKGHVGSICGSCLNKRKRQRIKNDCLDYLGGKCSNCGYNKNVAALHFHHTDPRLKLFGISHAYRYSLEKIREELDKCVILCANCHIELHHPNSDN